MPDQPNPDIPAHPAKFALKLVNFAKALASGDAVKVVAIGSSSTAGKGAVMPYPFYLQAELRGRFPGRSIIVLNRGKSGEEAPDEQKRLDTDVIAENPALVIWQVGTNAAWKGGDLDKVEQAIRTGLDQLRGKAMDVVLMDPQYVPALATPEMLARRAEDMVRRIANAAADAKVNLFQRFALMRAWQQKELVSFDSLVDMDDPDRLHQSKWSTRRVAIALGETIADAMPSLA